MQDTRALRALRVLGWVAAALYLLVGLVELVAAHDDPLTHRILFCLALALLAGLVMLGIRLMQRRPWPGLALASIAAVLGGFALFWTGLAIVLAVGIVVLGLIVARQLSQAPAGEAPAS